MTGRLSSLSFNSTGFGLVRPNTRAGHHVDIFTSLSNGGFNCNSSWGKAFAQPPVDWPTIKADFGRIIWQSGGRLVRMQIRKQIKIHEFDEEDRFFQWKKKKMKSQKCAVYQQHFNKYNGFRLMQEEEVRTGLLYDFVMHVREDSFWLKEMKPIHHFSDSAVSTKGCLRFGGINDKVAVVPRKFASAWFDIILQNYLYQIPRYKNPEDMSRKNAEVNSIPLVEVPVDYLPQLDIRKVETQTSPEGRLYQPAASGCFHPLYAGGKSLEPDDKECACVPSGLCKKVQARYCPFTKDK